MNPSSVKSNAVNGVVGWMKQKDLQLHAHVRIDEDPKRFIIRGIGDAFNRQWGGKKNLMYADLASFKGEVFKVTRTDKVGNNNWYYGELKGEFVWVHQSRLEDLQ